MCKILDYQKFQYQQKKRAKEMKANAAKIVIKEIRFGPNTDEHDFQFKLKHAQEFLQEGSKVKASIFFRGRSIMFASPWNSRSSGAPRTCRSWKASGCR